MLNYLRLRIQNLEELRKNIENNEEIKRKVSRNYFFSSVLGGMIFFVMVAGVKKKEMTWFKLLFFLYGLNPVMKTAGALSLMINVKENS